MSHFQQKYLLALAVATLLGLMTAPTAYAQQRVAEETRSMLVQVAFDQQELADLRPLVLGRDHPATPIACRGCDALPGGGHTVIIALLTPVGLQVRPSPTQPGVYMWIPASQIVGILSENHSITLIVRSR